MAPGNPNPPWLSSGSVQPGAASRAICAGSGVPSGTICQTSLVSAAAAPSSCN